MDANVDVSVRVWPAALAAAMSAGDWAAGRLLVWGEGWPGERVADAAVVADVPAVVRGVAVSRGSVGVRNRVLADEAEPLLVRGCAAAALSAGERVAFGVGAGMSADPVVRWAVLDPRGVIDAGLAEFDLVWPDFSLLVRVNDARRLDRLAEFGRDRDVRVRVSADRLIAEAVATDFGVPGDRRVIDAAVRDGVGLERARGLLVRFVSARTGRHVALRDPSSHVRAQACVWAPVSDETLRLARKDPDPDPTVRAKALQSQQRRRAHPVRRR